jgi:hypothetical protein
MDNSTDGIPATPSAQLKRELLTRAARRRHRPEPKTDEEFASPVEHRGESFHRRGGGAPAWSALYD